MARLPASRAAFGFLLFVALFAAGCPGSPPPVVARPQPSAAPSEPLVIRQSKTGLGFRLSNADASADAPPPRTVAPATALAAAEAKRLASRLPALASDPDDAKAFSMRDKSLPAPRAGKTVAEAFPPPASRPTTPPAAPGPLTVERHAPEGPVDLAPHLSITFSQPMVPVGTLADVGEVKPPALLSPMPAGKWRWLGTRTLLFQPEKRFPMATEFAVEIPAGTKSQTGGTLATAQRWTFTTPPPKVIRFYPSGTSVPLETLVYVELDQAIEPTSLLGSLELLSQGAPVPVRIATAEEIEDDAVVRRLSQQAEKGRWIALRPASKLAVARSYEIRLRAGAPSAEGPRKTTSPQASTFQTFGAMRLVAGTCGWRSTKDCKPLEDLHLRFTNPIEAEKFDKGMIAVTPEVQGLHVDVSGAYVTIRGRFKGRTRYSVTARGALPDVHGQTLEKDASVDFDIGSADPVLFRAERDMVVLDPASPRAYTVYSVNEPQLRARVYAVEPRDWAAYKAFDQEWERPRKLRAPGRLVSERVLTPAKQPDELVGTPVDLGPALTKGTGQALVVVESTRPPPKGYERSELHVWVQATELGLQAYIEREDVLGWVSRLGSGAPVPGAELSVLDAGGAPARTDAGGIAKVPLAAKGSLLVARSGSDVAFLPQAWDAGTSAFTKQPVIDGARWLVYDDRGMYKPGEEVRLKGWVRRAVTAKGGDLDAVPNVSGAPLSFRVLDARWAEIGKGSAKAEADGSFDVSFKLPGNANTGEGRVELSLAGAATSHTHVLQIEEFRRPEFEVSARATEGPHVVGEHAVATVTASYYAGGGLPAAPVTWRVSQETVPFSPPNRSDFHFGPEPYSWWSRPSPTKKDKPTSETWNAQTDGGGAHPLRLDFDAIDPPYPMKLDLVAEVVDVNRQQWAGRTSFLVHPADRAVGLRVAKSIVRAGENLDVDVVTTDLDGKAVAGRAVAVKLVKLESERRGSVWEDKEIEIASCQIESKAAPQEISRCSLRTKEGGSYRVVATVTDEAGRKSQTDVHAWAFGDTSPKDRSLDKATVQLVLDKTDHVPGDTAEVLVVAPFAPAEGVLTVRRQGVVTLERFSMASTTQVVRVKLDEALVPNALVQVDLVGAALRENASGEPDASLPKRPAHATGSLRASVLPSSRKLAVTATAKAKALEPGATTEITVDVKDPEGRALPGASVAVTVVDEAVLALSDYKTPDPIAVFYADRSPDVSDLELRDRVLLADPDLASLRTRAMATGNQLQAPGGGGVAYGRAAYPPSPPMAAPSASMAPGKPKEVSDKKRLALDENMAEAKADAAGANSAGKPSTPIKVRTNFDALALWAPKVTTDAQGRAKVALKLPDNLTRYRVMAVVAAGTKMFGSGESTVTARLPVMARLSAPRFLSFGDKFELPVVVQNQTDAPVDVSLVARATNATIGEPAGKRVKVAANDRVEVRFAAAAEKAGTARFQVGVATESFSDASQVEVPVYTPATSEAFATYGEIDEGAVAQPIQPPSNVFPQFGGLEITTSSTQLQALTDAFLYLVRYPYECNEQLSSRLVSVAALRDVLSAFKTEGMPKPDAIAAFAKEDMEKLKRRQKWDGGWGFWQEEPWPYLTVHVTHALVRAGEKGYAPDATMMERAKGYLRAIESKYPSWYSNETRRAITAYALYVRKRMGDADAARARRLIVEAGGVDKLGMEAVGWIWPTISEDKASTAENEAIRRLVANRAEETAGAAHFTTSYGDAAWVLLHSDRRVDGILLEALIGDQPQSTLIPKLVRGLLGHRKKGRWSNTQENAFVLLALDRYFATYEKVTPDFVARAWLGDRFAGQHAFKGRTTEQSEVRIPMQWIATEVKGPQTLVLGKDGPGRLYYRVGMQYAPTDLKPPPTDQGFAVSRVYEGVDKPDDVRRDPDGTWRMKAGARVRSRVTMVAPARRYHVALVDPLPAGLEPMNPALAVTGELPKDPRMEAQGGKYGYWHRTWYEHQNLRDERAEAFASLLWDGVWEYAWVARATTPGTFVVAPAKAEEMYSPEVFGRSAGDRVVVE